MNLPQSQDLARAGAADLPSLVRQAAEALARAGTAAEVLDAKEHAGLVYDAAKRAARLLKAKGAHDKLVAATHRAQADALVIEAEAKRRLADEYDAAQGRGEVAKGRPKSLPDGNSSVTAAQIGIASKDIHDARQVRDVIVANPAAVREALNDILAKGDEPTRTALKKAIAPAVKTIRAEVQAEKKERRQTREIELGARQHALPVKRYGVIYTDPEWRFEPRSRETGMDRAADNHYPTSELEAIKARDVGAIAAKDCTLFLWATAPMLPQALEVMATWGFAYVSHIVWAKQRSGRARGPGYWFTGEHELLLVGTRGNVPAPAPGTQVPSVIAAPVAKHSAKPAEFAEVIERYFPSLPKVELNARTARPGWDVWGNEAPAAAPPAADAPRLPPGPTKRHHVEFQVGGMKKGSHARFCVDMNEDGSFAVSHRIEIKGRSGVASPYVGAFESFADALAHALDVIRKLLTAVSQAKDSATNDHHRAAARAGIAWCEARVVEWGLPAPSAPTDKRRVPA